MSLPPAIINVKRKIGEDPVEYFQIHHEDSGAGKRRKVPAGYIFTRQPTDDDNGPASNPLLPQPVRRIKELHRSASSQALGTSAHTSSPDTSTPETPLSQDVLPTATPTSTPLDHTPRRFHMSRITTPIGSTPTVAGRKRKDAALFVERKRPRSSAGPTKTPQPGKIAAQTLSEQETPQTEQEKPGPGFGTPASEERPRKKPGLAARSSTPPVRPHSTSKPLVPPLRNVRLPSGAMMPWDVSSERLTAEMQAYTLSEIGRTLALQEEEAAAEASRLASLRAAKSAPSPQKYSSKFKPKKPALRYAERHPGEKVVPEHEAMEVDESHIGDEGDEDMDDGEYIIDTYVRIPADALETNEQPKNFGLLVLDSQPDIDEFYQEETDSEEEDDDEEEDENAENHYTADYPDEEIASDDEFDRNAYHYRTDLEEYDETFEDEDVALSDDDGDATRYPWMAKMRPWMRGVEKSILDADGEEG